VSGETFGTAADLFAAEDAARGGRKLDERATKIARLAHEREADRLRALFGVLPEHDEEGKLLPPPRRVLNALIRAGAFGESGGRGRPVRLKAGCPPVRDAEHQAKHRARKRAHESRRRNRG
jgi:hypothetical protein